MKYLSLFSGIGGFELGIQQYVETTSRKKNRGSENDSEKNVETGKRLESTERQTARTEKRQSRKHIDVESEFRQFTCVGYSEIDKYATQIYQKHFPEHKKLGDITLVRAYNIPNFDLLVGGFPCQSFSIAGKRGGFADTRGTLFFEIARIIANKKPRLLLLENVKGLLSHDSQNTFRVILETLDELGYDVQWQVLNSKNFGVPQNRERVFIVGHLRGTPRPEVFPFIRIGEKNNDWKYESSNKQNLSDFWYKSYDNFLSGRETYTIRRLTPKECERLQGFPDDWTAGLSDTQRYKCIGNAVTVNVIQTIIEKICQE